MTPSIGKYQIPWGQAARSCAVWGDPERHERGPPRLQIQHLGCDVLGEQPCQRAEAAARRALAGTALQSRTRHRHVAERRRDAEAP